MRILFISLATISAVGVLLGIGELSDPNHTVLHIQQFWSAILVFTGMLIFVISVAQVISNPSKSKDAATKDMTPVKSDAGYMCPGCNSAVQIPVKPKKNFTGFPSVPCSSCNRKLLLPLSKGYVAGYWIYLAANAVFIAAFVAATGQIPGVNPIGFVFVWFAVASLLKNARLKRQFSAEEIGSPDA